MSGNAARRGPQRHLSLVPCVPYRRPGLRAATGAVRLWDAPFRPGELPAVVSVRLSSETVGRANSQAVSAGAPVELWVRAAIDAGRLMSAISPIGPAVISRIMATLDEHAAPSLPLLSALSDLALYAEALRRGEPASVTQLGKDGEIELLVPEELRQAWSLEAAESGSTLDCWATSMIAAAPDHALSREAAAVASGLRLAEWGYACALRRLTRASASPQRLT
jgi:hypothetical protein